MPDRPQHPRAPKLATAGMEPRSDSCLLRPVREQALTRVKIAVPDDWSVPTLPVADVLADGS